MARICDNGIYRDMTAEELAALEQETPDALTEMVTAISTASTLEQMREAAKIFLNKTEI